MKQTKHIRTAREYGFAVGQMQPGPRNLITDVSGVRVGHVTISRGDVQTGVTAVLPHEGNLFQEKLMAASHVINGFGKSMGLIQINEMGTLETPVILTNTLGIGTTADALIRYMLEQNPDIGSTTGSVNPVICECNDGYLNDIRGMHVTGEHVRQAIDSAAAVFDQGSAGAGTGMCAYGLKGGIGSASRVVHLDSDQYTLGALVLANMGKKRDLTVCGRHLGAMLGPVPGTESGPIPGGSIIIILATDLPLCERQLGRIARRAQAGVARTGSNIDSGSGEIVVAFSTASRIRHYEHRAVVTLPRLNEDRLNSVFRAVAECTEEAVLNALVMGATTTGINGRTVYSLADFLENFVSEITEKEFLMKSSTNLDKAGVVKEVTERFTQLVAAINQKDAAAWETFYDRDEFVSAVAGGMFFATRSDWIQAIQSNFAMRDRQHLELRKVQVIPLTPDTALLTSQEMAEMQLKSGQATLSRHVFTMIWKKGRQGWQIIHSHESWVDEPVE